MIREFGLFRTREGFSKAQMGFSFYNSFQDIEKEIIPQLKNLSRVIAGFRKSGSTGDGRDKKTYPPTGKDKPDKRIL